MSDVQATTQTQGAAVSTDPRFDSFFSDGPAVEPPRDDAAAAGSQGAADDDGDGAGDASAFQNAGGQEQQQHPDGQQQAAPADANTPKFASLSEMLAAHKVAPDLDWQALTVTAKIDGKEMQVPFSDVLKSYQLEGHVNNKSIELSNKHASFDQERTQWNTAVQKQIGEHRAIANYAIQLLNHDFQKVDWNSLRTSNPAEFAALQAEFGQRQQAIQQLIQNVDLQQQQVNTEQQQARRTALAGEHEKLMNARPEWRDEKAFVKDRDDMSKYARSIGFQDAELSQILDHRYMLILHDAARFRALQAAAPEVLNKVRQAPVMAAPGSRTETNQQDAQRRKVLDRVNRNPRDRDAQAAAFEFFAGQ